MSQGQYTLLQQKACNGYIVCLHGRNIYKTLKDHAMICKFFTMQMLQKLNLSSNIFLYMNILKTSIHFSQHNIRFDRSISFPRICCEWKNTEVSILPSSTSSQFGHNPCFVLVKIMGNWNQANYIIL